MTSPDLECIESFILGLTESNVSIVAEVIGEGNEVLISLDGGVHWTKNVTKNPANNFRRSLLGDLQYYILGLLSLMASRTKLTSISNYLHTGSHLGLHHSQYGVLTDVTKVTVP